MNAFPSAYALILVAVMPEPRDMEIARLLGWYRIPLRFAPKVVNVDYVAFYQPGTFGPQHRWKIETYAQVRGHELATRAELFRDQPDHPRAREEYYKIQLDSLCTLQEPIAAGDWKRITFLYTTGEQFQRARVVNDLVVGSEERRLLWRSLRERSLQEGTYTPDELPELPLDPALLAMLGDLGRFG